MHETAVDNIVALSDRSKAKVKVQGLPVSGNFEEISSISEISEISRFRADQISGVILT